jgi:hypothetical protein
MYCQLPSEQVNCDHAQALLSRACRRRQRAALSIAYETGSSGPLHVEARHGVTPDEVVETYFGGLTTWNPTNLRFETRTETHTLHWAWHASGAVLVITCFQKGDQ